MFKYIKSLFRKKSEGAWNVDFKKNNIQLGDNFICKISNIHIEGNNNSLTIGDNFKCDGVFLL